MPEWLRYPVQAVNYSIFMLLVWYLSAAPSYLHLTPEQAVITMAFSHAGERLEECRKLSQEELEKLPPNMRTPLDCPRERSPVSVELLLDGERIIDRVLNPPGLYSDLGIDVYLSAKVPAGTHRLTMAMNDNANVQGFTHTDEQTVTLQPSQLLVVNFNSETGRFYIQ
jgi:hypothetical protein